LHFVVVCLWVRCVACFFFWRPTQTEKASNLTQGQPDLGTQYQWTCAPLALRHDTPPPSRTTTPAYEDYPTLDPTSHPCQASTAWHDGRQRSASPRHPAALMSIRALPTAKLTQKARILWCVRSLPRWRLSRPSWPQIAERAVSNPGPQRFRSQEGDCLPNETHKRVSAQSCENDSVLHGAKPVGPAAGIHGLDTVIDGNP